MEVVKITADRVEEILKGTAGAFFRVTFIKRTDGSLRTMVARTGVVKHLKGGVAAYSFAAKRLLSCFDVEKMGYRSIPLENVKFIATDGHIYEVTE